MSTARSRRSSSSTARAPGPRTRRAVPPRGLLQVQSKFEYLRTAHAMTTSDIRETQLDFVQAAKRARSAGFDVITVYCAMATDLTHQFLMPLFNKRTDEYGGSFENRARYLMEVLELVREAVGDDCAISVRFGLDTLPFPEGLGDGGIRADGDGLRVIEHADHLVDMWDIQCGWAMEWARTPALPGRTRRTTRASTRRRSSSTRRSR